jgi:hypothetical protein
LNLDYFSTGSLAVLRSIENLHMRDVGTQSSQLLSLASQLDSLPPRIIEQIVLPTICKLSKANIALWVYTLPLHEYFAKTVPKKAYIDIAGPFLGEGMKASAAPADVIQAFLKNVNFVLSTFDNSFFKINFVCGVICGALDSPASAVKISGFQTLFQDQVRLVIDNSMITEYLIPRICREACRNPESRIKIHGLYLMSLLCFRLDREFLRKNILPSLKWISARDKDPIVSMCIVGNYDAIADCVGPDYIATEILPTIQPMLIDKTLNRQQFEQVRPHEMKYLSCNRRSLFYT